MYKIPSKNALSSTQTNLTGSDWITFDSNTRVLNITPTAKGVIILRIVCSDQFGGSVS